jgi:hypothetical protein
VDVPDCLALIVFNDVGGSNALRYCTYNGSTLSGNSNVGITFGGGDYGTVVKMAPSATTSTVSLLVGTANGCLLASQWNGSSWSAQTQLSSTLPTWSGQTFASAVEAVTGRIIAMYSDTTKSYYRIYSSGAWGAQQTVTGGSGNLRWLRAASRPGTNQIYLIGLDSGSNVGVSAWNGSAWNTPSLAAAGVGSNNQQVVDVACSSDGTSVLAAYSINSSTIAYRTWGGAAWSAQQNGPNISAKVGNAVILIPGPRRTRPVICTPRCGAALLSAAPSSRTQICPTVVCASA